MNEHEARLRSLWRYHGQARPAFAITPARGQESVWDYPRPPAVLPDAREVVVRCGPIEIARSMRAIRVLETASPPTFYLPVEDVRMEMLAPAQGRSVCEWKGESVYWSVVTTHARLDAVAWSYPRPTERFAAIKNHLSFYPSRLDCTVAGVRVEPQAGGFYGGWITPDIVGPCKGEPGSQGW